MNKKLLFTAALMSAMAGTVQVAWADVRGVDGVENSWAMPMDEKLSCPNLWPFMIFSLKRKRVMN